MSDIRVVQNVALADAQAKAGVSTVDQINVQGMCQRQLEP